MILEFQTIASGPAAPAPSDLAHGISVAALPSIAVVPLGLLGIVLVVAGIVVRQPLDQP